MEKILSSNDKRNQKVEKRYSIFSKNVSIPMYKFLDEMVLFDLELNLKAMKEYAIENAGFTTDMFCEFAKEYTISFSYSDGEIKIQNEDGEAVSENIAVYDDYYTYVGKFLKETIAKCFADAGLVTKIKCEKNSEYNGKYNITYTCYYSGDVIKNADLRTNHINIAMWLEKINQSIKRKYIQYFNVFAPFLKSVIRNYIRPRIEHSAEENKAFRGNGKVEYSVCIYYTSSNQLLEVNEYHGDEIQSSTFEKIGNAKISLKFFEAIVAEICQKGYVGLYLKGSGIYNNKSLSCCFCNYK